jgi:hypothetical protein
MVLLHLVRLSRRYRLMHTLICLTNHPHASRDLLLHQIQPDADADDDFGFNEVTSYFEDAKNYNPVTGTDE